MVFNKYGADAELEYKDILSVKNRKEPRKGQTLCGYGKALPTQFMIQTHDKRYHRVYCTRFSNTGYPYIHVGKIDASVESALDQYLTERPR